MFRRSSALLAGLVEYHEWQLREPLLINYEGWRILDNPKMTYWETYVSDLGGTGRHLDPIIDDPRMTHSQRVCRLYRWALREYNSYLRGAMIGQKGNIAYKVVRMRFEKYRYVTDPAMCDMMVRVTQKYLRETCFPGVVFLRRNSTSPWSNLCGSNPMYHPDNCLVYDHWTPVETFWYDDAKLHRYPAHSPINAGAGENYERYGTLEEVRAAWVRPMTFLTLFLLLSGFFTYLGFGYMFFAQRDLTDSRTDIANQRFERSLELAIAAEERSRRAKYDTSFIGFNWDRVIGGKSKASEGIIYRGA